MSRHRRPLTALGGAALLLGVIIGCAPRRDAASAASDLSKSIDAAELFSMKFRDSALASLDTTRFLDNKRDPASSVVPDACDTPTSHTPTQEHTTPQFTLTLPVDFEPVAPHEWRGDDSATVRVISRQDTVVRDTVLGRHRGLVGEISSECDVPDEGGTTHVDVAATTGADGRADRVVQVNLGERTLAGRGEMTIRRSLLLIAHARSVERQRDLLRAAKSLKVRGQR